ncbi:GNAT family N-acetyltransferase [Chlorogloeopsis sp. ULAP02]|uniref:GNAT family N-acetyltransferase n=1 Tax=Chlorogloeopsis sp. ULAP02 TaxID=3107926 RepID=UPI00313631C4
MKKYYQDFLIRDWQECDRIPAAEVIRSVLSEYGLGWEPNGADQDVLQVEEYYLATGGEFWIIEHQNKLVGTGAYYPIKRSENAVEIRKMYFLPSVRGLGLGKYLLQQLEEAIASRGFLSIWIETASVLAQAVKLYESNGYISATGVETTRCDRVYVKSLMTNSP